MFSHHRVTRKDVFSEHERRQRQTMIHVLFTFPDRFSLPILHIGRSYTYKDSKKGGAITDATFHFFALSVQQQACLLHNSADATRTGHDNDGFTSHRLQDIFRRNFMTDRA